MKIVQIGTNNGLDNVNEFVKINKNTIDFLLLIEPLSIHNKSIIYNYNWLDNLIIENVVISELDNEDIIFYSHKNNLKSEYDVSSLEINHLYKHLLFDDGLIKHNLKSRNINNLLDDYNINELDYLFIDAEGYDDKIIKTIDFNRKTIKNIYFEMLHITDFNNIKNFLENNNYILKENVGYGGWDCEATLKFN